MVVGGGFIRKGSSLGIFVFDRDKVAFVVDAAVRDTQEYFCSWDSLQINKALVTHEAFVRCEWNFTVDGHFVATFMQNSNYFTKILPFISLKYRRSSLLV